MADAAFGVAVVGAGPAGLAAACRAAESGARVALIGDDPWPGGQIWRGPQIQTPRAAARWIGLARQRNVELVTGASVFAAPAPGVLAFEQSGAGGELRYRALILATGARERFLPFPGWTLPNVTGAGGLQALAKSGAPVQDKKVIVAGSGPLLLAVAHYLRTRGADVRLVAEQAEGSAVVRFGLNLARHPRKLIQAARLRAALPGVRYLTGCWPVSARGEGKLEAVTLRRRDRSWEEPCDFLACGFGLVPNTELGALLGCRLSSGGVAVDDYQETSLPGVFAAGEVTGIGGVELALCEGEVAGYAASGGRDQARGVFRARAWQRRFASRLERAFALRPELKHLAQDDTIVCRCEDVTFGEARRCSGWREAKLHTRMGMGPCQGRVCGDAVKSVLGWTPESVRPPLFPVRVGTIGGMAGDGRGR
jgi:NADPH-dependent 2,4-dienoyl-CoA reductase/sulfur reductase-like enzyme